MPNHRRSTIVPCGTQSLRSFGPSHFVGPSPYPCPGVDTSARDNSRTAYTVSGFDNFIQMRMPLRPLMK